jgi:folate-binding protein YgfZ
MFNLEGYQAVHAHGGVVRRTDRRVLAISGADRATWLQGLVTNDVQNLVAGESRYAAWLTPQGRMITDMNVVASGDRLLLDVPATLAADLRERLDGLIFAEDVTVTDESGRLLVWTVINDAFIDVVGEALPAEYRRLREIDLDTFDVIRIERGVPKFVEDMSGDTIPLEAGIESRAISFTKGCYIGQEVIVRVTTRGGGRVSRKLVRWHADDSAPVVPLHDAPIWSHDPSTPPGAGPSTSLRAGPSTSLRASRQIGRVTSAAFSPALGKVVGLGYVQRKFADPGTEITIVWNDAHFKAAVK